MRHKNTDVISMIFRLLTLLQLLFGMSLAGCASYTTTVDDDSYRYDFYSTADGLRILASASMPPLALNGSYDDQKQRCIQAARQKADSKWLALTETTIEVQTLWYQRLQRGASGPWQRCFDKATVLRYIPSGESCSVVMLYSCDPRDW